MPSGPDACATSGFDPAFAACSAYRSRPTHGSAPTDAELDAFIEAETDHLVSRGVPVAEAREQVLRNLGAPLHDVRQDFTTP